MFAASSDQGASYCTHPTHDVIDVWRLARYLFRTVGCEFFYVPQESDYCKCCETGPTVFRPYPRRLVCRCHALSSQLFKDSECWTGQGSSPRPPAQLTRALQSELTRRWLERKLILSKATSKQIRNHDTTKRRCDLNHNTINKLNLGPVQRPNFSWAEPSRRCLKLVELH